MNLKGNLQTAGLVAALTLSGAVGCSSTQQKENLVTETNYQREPTPTEFTEVVSGDELRRVTEQDRPYSLEEKVIHETRVFIEPNERANENELPIVMKLYEGHTRDLENGEIVTDLVYIPTAITNKEGETVKSGSFATTGRYAVTAEMSDFDISNVQTGIIKTTHNDARFDIETITLMGKEHYVPKVPNRETNQPGLLDFYLIGKEDFREMLGHIHGTNKAKILLKARENAEFPGVYRPKAVSFEEYNARKPLENPVSEEDNPGEFSPN